jgi:HK97 family phage major capsid protein
MDTTEIVEQIDGLGHAWEEYKTTNDQRLREIEKRGSADALYTDKLKRLDKRLDGIEVAINRTPRGEPGDWGKGEPTLEQKAFGNYLKIGRDAMQPAELKSLSLGPDPAAGFLAPQEYVHEIIKAEIEFSPIRQVARVRPTARRSAQFPKRTATFGAVWVSEQGQRAETQGLTYGLEEIAAHEFYALVDVSQQLLEDSAFNLESELSGEFSEQFAVTEGLAFVSGNGVGRPEGILSNTSVGFTVSGSAGTISDSDGQANGLVDLSHALKTSYANAGTWLLNRTTLASVRKMKDDQKNYVWTPGLASGIANQILGAPYVEVPDMPSEGADTYPVAFGDWRRAYVIADRIHMSILRDPFTQATNGNVRYIARRRVGGQVVLAEACRLLKCST